MEKITTKLEIKATLDGKEGTSFISDGYYTFDTFDELYDHRITLFITILFGAPNPTRTAPCMMVGLSDVLDYLKAL
jgi:hypothetical protein